MRLWFTQNTLLRQISFTCMSDDKVPTRLKASFELFRSVFPSNKYPYRVFRFQIVQGFHEMARNQQQWQFLNYTLSESETIALQQFVDNDVDGILPLMDVLLGQGYKVSMTWVDQNTAFCIAVTGTENSKYNNGKSMTSWSDSLEEGLFIAVYKHLVIFGGKEWVGQDVQKRWG